jgi:hypothetical protein
MKATFRKFDDASIASSQAAWTAESTAAGMFPAEVEQVFEWTRNHMTLVNNEIAYGIFDDGGTDAFAIVEVVETRKSARSNMIKMLRMRLRPSMEAEIYSGDLSSFQRALECYGAAFFGIYRLRGTDKSTVLKFYGRSNEQLGFLKALVAGLQKRTKGHEFRMDGRWLVIQPT